MLRIADNASVGLNYMVVLCSGCGVLLVSTSGRLLIIGGNWFYRLFWKEWCFLNFSEIGFCYVR